MNKLRILHLFVASIIALTLPACKKDISNSREVAIGNSQTHDSPNFDFPWYSATGMPVAPSVPVGNIPSMPWQSQGGSPIDPNIISDYKKTDGWELVYNTFNNTTLPYLANLPAGGLYFALYNKYRGILRFYLYMPAGLINNNQNIQHGLSVFSQNGSTSTMLNFEGTDLVDINARTPYISKANNVGVAVTGGWYAMQYEMAYDPNALTATATYPNLGLQWNSRTVSISDIKLGGSEAGTITGSITQQSSSTSSTIINGALSAAEILGIALGSGGSGSFDSNLVNAATGGLAGNFTNFLSGIFGGNSNNTQEVDLKMNTTITLTGTLTGSQNLAPNTFVVPGQAQQNTIGAPNPLTSDAFGVFNLSNRPVINSVSYTPTPARDNSITSTTFSLDNSSFSIQWNPAILAAANITNLHKQILLINADGLGSSTTYTNTTRANIGNLAVYAAPADLPAVWKIRDVAPVYVPQYAIRISFNVVPTDPAYTGPPITIVKSFLANHVGN